jgi:endoglucanase
LAVWLVVLTSISADARLDLMSLQVVRNQLQDSAGSEVHLMGVDRSGTEYACIQGWGIFDGPSDDASVAAIASWGANAVGIGLNEDCWLGINGAPSRYSGARYIQAITDYVQLLHRHGLYAVLALTWAAPGGNQAKWQEAMADQDHALVFWSSVAAAFRSDQATLFELYGEPAWISWPCWADGCTYSDKYGSWHTAGMGQMLHVVRQAGAHNVVLAGGIDYANNLTGWLAYSPNDPDHQLAASFHVYGDTTCRDPECWDSSVREVAKRVPVVTAALGERANGSSCGHDFVDSYLGYAHRNGLSYLAWAWDTWNPCSTLILDYGGTPTVFGAAYRSRLLNAEPFTNLTFTASIPSRPLFEIPSKLRHERLDLGVAGTVGLIGLAGWLMYRRRRFAA